MAEGRTFQIKHGLLATIGTLSAAELGVVTDVGAVGLYVGDGAANWAVLMARQATAAGLALMDDANAAAQLATLGAAPSATAVVGPASATDNAIVRFDAATGKLVQDSGVTISDAGDLSVGTRVVTGIAVTDTATLGNELCLNGGFATNDFTSWTAGANWSAATGVAVATAPAGTLVQTIALEAGKEYQLSYVLARSAGTMVLTFGSMPGSYSQTSAGTKYATFTCTNSANYDLTFTPNSSFAGSVDTVSVKEVSGVNGPLVGLFNADASAGVELRSGGIAAGNLFMGYQSGQKRTEGVYNVGIGYQTLAKLTTGNWNVGVGYQVFPILTTGVSNFGMGGKAGYVLTIGGYNIGIGILALGALSIGSNNIAIGYAAGDTLATGSNNVFIGYIAGLNALQKVDAVDSMALGKGTYTTADYQVVIGDGSVTEVRMGQARAADLLAGKFGCNAKTAQTAYSGGAALDAYVTGAFGLDSDAHVSALYAMVVAIRAALVANGIMT